MKKFLGSVSMVLGSVLVHPVFAQGTDAAAPAYNVSPTVSTGGAGLIIVLGILYLAFVIFCFVTWIRMIVHAAKHPIENKALWIVLMVFAGIIGAAIYYFVIKRPFDKAHPKMK